MSAGDTPFYFESSWSILSTIGLVNSLCGFMVVGITGYSALALVPIVVSVAAALANGLCFYALYEHHDRTATLVGGIFADIFWLIQEAGLSFYSYMILNRVLQNRSRIVFLSLFWLLMTIIVGVRFGILVYRARYAITGVSALQTTVAQLHIGYFVAIAVIEIISAGFLLRVFTKAKKGSKEVTSRGGLFQYLTQSTELRLATLALVGTTRAITYSFQRSVVASSNTGQVDRFVFTLECMFPIVM
ncbi:hypothetical protein EK21DRAFT_66839 [Setomelanomma holmii]|uniref:Uncharacterized protein n=1 Tax=Setomelanomma holmii TaxID=210430 RepID=A0A9P4H826_9PLEO|nr:hypothetical protein EK21DRAFT_66839 [Setomelanomma holmii]